MNPILVELLRAAYLTSRDDALRREKPHNLYLLPADKFLVRIEPITYRRVK